MARHSIRRAAARRTVSTLREPWRHGLHFFVMQSTSRCAEHKVIYPAGGSCPECEENMGPPKARPVPAPRPKSTEQQEEAEDWAHFLKIWMDGLGPNPAPVTERTGPTAGSGPGDVAWEFRELVRTWNHAMPSPRHFLKHVMGLSDKDAKEIIAEIAGIPEARSGEWSWVQRERYSLPPIISRRRRIVDVLLLAGTVSAWTWWAKSQGMDVAFLGESAGALAFLAIMAKQMFGQGGYTRSGGPR